MDRESPKKNLNALKVFANGLLNENPAFRLLLGTCPTLAITTSVSNGLGMGVAAIFVLLCSNVVISLLRKLIPQQVRLPSFIVIIASFVTLTQMLVKAFLPALDASLGVYLPLLTVNCIILARAEVFASKNNVFVSALDGLGMGIGFTMALVLMSAMRELMGAGSLMGFAILPKAIPPMAIMTQPPGGFFVFGVLVALVAFIENRLGKKSSQKMACVACPSAAVCEELSETNADGQKGENEESEAMTADTKDLGELDTKPKTKKEEEADEK